MTAAELAQAALSTLVVGSLGTWFAMCAASQWRTGAVIRRLRSADALGLLPSWATFAPNPVQVDYAVFYRDADAHGTVTPWQALPLVERGRRPGWNPARRVQRAHLDLCLSLIRAARRPDAGRELLVQLPYLVLLACVSAQPRTPFSHRRQFLIASAPRRPVAPDDEDADVVFVSTFHHLEP